jgi:hypothetical protein
MLGDTKDPVHGVIALPKRPIHGIWAASARRTKVARVVEPRLARDASSLGDDRRAATEAAARDALTEPITMIGIVRSRIS